MTEIKSIAEAGIVFFELLRKGSVRLLRRCSYTWIRMTPLHKDWDSIFPLRQNSQNELLFREICLFQIASPILSQGYHLI